MLLVFVRNVQLYSLRLVSPDVGYILEGFDRTALRRWLADYFLPQVFSSMMRAHFRGFGYSSLGQ